MDPHAIRTQVPMAAIAQSALSPGGNLPATCLAGGSQLDKELVGASFGLDSKQFTVACGIDNDNGCSN